MNHDGDFESSKRPEAFFVLFGIWAKYAITNLCLTDVTVIAFSLCTKGYVVLISRW